MNSPIRVAILTTGSLVVIQRVEPEENSARSVMCIDRTSVETGVSREYNRFVRRGTGVIAQVTGTDAFRMDVDSEVTDGRSFHLPVFLAHVLRQDRRLAGAETDASALWVATGEVDADLNVRGVDGISQKLRVLDAWLSTAPAGHPAVCLLLPEHNRAQADPDLLAALRQRGVRVRFISKAGMPEDVRDGTMPPPTARTPRHGGRLRVSAAAASLVLMGGVAWWTSAGLPVATPRPPNQTPLTVTRQPARDGTAQASAPNASVPARDGATVFASNLPAADVPDAVEVVVRDTVGGPGGCYGGDRTVLEYRARTGGEIVLPSRAGRCRVEVRAQTTAGAALHAYLAGGGPSGGPVDLGPRGSLTTSLLTDGTPVTVIGARPATRTPAGPASAAGVTIRIATAAPK
ncbi:MAG: hypothetical protein AB7H96_22930 [Vicinamibacterales bacterium]